VNVGRYCRDGALEAAAHEDGRCGRAGGAAVAQQAQRGEQLPARLGVAAGLVPAGKAVACLRRVGE
jgi:hypothetical protein